MKTWRTWTVKERKQLEALRWEGLTIPQIAQRMGRTEASIRCRIIQDEVPRGPRSLKWLELLNQPHTIAGLASSMGLTKWAVKQAKRRLRRAGYDVPAANRE